MSGHVGGAKCPDMWAGQMSGHVGRANVRTCGQGKCPDMWAGSMSGHVGRVNVRTCGQGKYPDMWAGKTSGHVGRINASSRSQAILGVHRHGHRPTKTKQKVAYHIYFDKLITKMRSNDV